MSVNSAASAAEAAAPPPASVVAVWRETTKEKKVAVVVLLAIGFWSLYKYFTAPTTKDAAAAAKKSTDTPLSSDEREGSITSDAAADLRTAAASYGKAYQDRMRATVAVPTEASNARPFIGFSLADNIVAGALVVDGVFVDGPADQTGVDIDHELLSINNEPASSIDGVRQLVAKHCRAGQVTRMKLRKEDAGVAYEVLLWVMTADEAFRTKPYFFDTTAHRVRQSERLKQTWTRETSQEKK